MRNILFIIAVCSLWACSATKNSSSQNNDLRLRFVNEYRIPFGYQFQQTTVGGLSGIDRDADNDLYYFISDDRSDNNPARFYTANIRVTAKGIDTVQFRSVHFLRQQDGSLFPNSKTNPQQTPDPEAIRYFKQGNIIWTSEGERIIRANGNNVLHDPTVYMADTTGAFKDSFSFPSIYKMHATEEGPRRNGVFEGASFNRSKTKLYVNVEEPLYNDGERAGAKDSTGVIRILQFDVNTKKFEKAFAYTIDPVAHEPVPQSAFKINGVPDIFFLNDHQFLVVERSFSTGRVPCTIHVYLSDLNDADEIGERPIQQVKRLPKKLVVNMDSLGIFTDNIEGVCWGPTLSNGHRSLIFVSDDNFSATQRTQLLLFEIE